jgi:hypothetical protein
LHDDHGRLVAIAKLGELKEAGSRFVRAGMLAGRGQRIVEVDLDEEIEKIPLRELHAGYRFDLSSSKLVKTS